MKEPILIPKFDEQLDISTFLDKKTAAIDAAIAKKERLLARLEEKRAAVINQAVTKGLDPTVPMKDSGIPWIGQIPAHWELRKVGHFSQIGNGSDPRKEYDRYWVNGTIPWLNSSVVNDFDVYSAKNFVTPTAIKECHLPRVPPKSLLVGLTGDGRTRGMACILWFLSTISRHLAFVIPDPSVMGPHYMRCCFVSAYEFIRGISNGMGSTKGALSCADLSDLRFPRPSLEEQKRISEFCAETDARITEVKVRLTSQINRLREYRQALITAAVTGQLRVPEAEERREEELMK